MRQTLAALTAMRIRFPGKTEEEAEAVLDEVGVLFSVACTFCIILYNNPACDVADHNVRVCARCIKTNLHEKEKSD